jgi:hypothetical protein
MTANEINQAIINRSLFHGQEEDTYHTKELYDFACDNFDDPNLLFKLEIYGYYKVKYKWSKEQADWFIMNHLEDSVKWSDGLQEYFYDWGRGKNEITKHVMHFPHLDHIIPREQGGTDDPENMRIRVKRLNESKGNINSDSERRAVIIDNFQDMILENQILVLEYLKELLDKTK